MTRPTFEKLEGRAFVHPTESIDKVRKALENTFGGEVELSKSSPEGGLIVLTIELEDDVRQKLKSIVKRLSSTGRESITHSLERRIDETGNFFFKIDKQEAYNDRLEVSRDSSKGVIWLSVSMVSYPSKKESYLEELEKIFKH